jgi:phenylalanyl-tRNA synthetase beta subunit
LILHVDGVQVDPVRIVYADGRELISPDLRPLAMDTSVEYINHGLGLNLTASQIVRLLLRMQIVATADADGRSIRILFCRLSTVVADGASKRSTMMIDTRG